MRPSATRGLAAGPANLTGGGVFRVGVRGLAARRRGRARLANLKSRCICGVIIRLEGRASTISWGGPPWSATATRAHLGALSPLERAPRVASEGVIALRSPKAAAPTSTRRVRSTRPTRVGSRAVLRVLKRAVRLHGKTCRAHGPTLDAEAVRVTALRVMATANAKAHGSLTSTAGAKDLGLIALTSSVPARGRARGRPLADGVHVARATSEAPSLAVARVGH